MSLAGLAVLLTLSGPGSILISDPSLAPSWKALERSGERTVRERDQRSARGAAPERRRARRYVLTVSAAV
jgi:hypothetical protein